MRTTPTDSFISRQVDARIHWSLDRRLNWEISGAHFFPGKFVRNTGVAIGKNFFHTAASLRS